MHVRRAAVAAAAFAIASIPFASPASAAPPIHETESFPDLFVVEDWCGVPDLDVTVDQMVTVDVVIKKGDRGPAYYIEHFTITATHTANGVSTTYVERSVSKDLKLSVDEETGYLVIDVLQTGNASLYGPDGRLIAKNPGQVRFHIVYDEATDTEISFELTKGSTGRTDDFCAVEVPLFLA